RARAQLMRCRYVAALFLTALAAYVFFFCLSFFGWPTAACALLLVAFNPTLLGNARYVATDLPAATLWMVGVGEAVRYLSGRSRWGAAREAQRRALDPDRYADRARRGGGRAWALSRFAAPPAPRSLVFALCARGADRHRVHQRGLQIRPHRLARAGHSRIARA